MPIYAYKCGSCGHAKDVLQKISDNPQTQCPACGQQTWSKQLSAPGFQLKGTGWYATDFKNGGNNTAPAVPAPENGGSTAPAEGATPAVSAGSATSADQSVSSSASQTNSAPSPSPSPSSSSSSSSSVSTSVASSSSAASCSPGCACH